MSLLHVIKKGKTSDITVPRADTWPNADVDENTGGGVVIVWGFSSHSRNFRSYGDVTIASEVLCSALMAIEQLGLFNVPHLLWHEASVYNGHLRRPVTITPNAERVVVELTLPVLKSWVCRDFRKLNPPLAGQTSKPPLISRNIILFDVYFGKLFNFNILIMI